MSRPLSYIGVLTFLSILLLGCKEKNVLNKGIYEIIESDSGKIQTQRMHPVAKRLKELDVPGVSIAVIDDYRIHDLITFGNRDSLNFVNSNTIFQAASVSKYVTAIIVHQFISQELLDLDTDVNQYLKSWKVPKNDFTQDTPVTLRLLLSHQSGLPSTNFDFDKNQGVPTLVQILNADSPAINEPAIPNAIPGSRWSYSNIGYALIQQILEDITDKSFQEIAKEILKKVLNGEKNLLKIVAFKTKGISFYHSVVQNKLVHINRQTEFFLLPLKKDERGRLFILTTGLFNSGEIILVPEDEIEILGQN